MNYNTLDGLVEPEKKLEKKEDVNNGINRPVEEVTSDIDEIPYEVRMKHIINAYRRDQDKWAKLGQYAKHLESEVIRLKEIMVLNGYADPGVVGNSKPAQVIAELKDEIVELKKTIKDQQKAIKDPDGRIKHLEEMIKKTIHAECII